MQNEKRAKTRSWKGEDLCAKYRPYFERREAVCSKDIGFCRFFNQKNSLSFGRVRRGYVPLGNAKLLLERNLPSFNMRNTFDVTVNKMGVRVGMLNDFIRVDINCFVSI